MAGQLLISDGSELRAEAAEISEIEQDQPVSILFIGNSLTYYRAKGKPNYFLDYFEKLSKAGGHEVSISRVTRSGQKLKNFADPDHKDGKKVYQAIASKKWDYVVLQENTNYAVGYNSTFQKAAKKLAEAIYANNPETTIVYNCTWAFENGGRVNGRRYSYKSMQKQMNANYQQAALATDGMISWAGSAFYNCRREHPGLKLYVSDQNHPSRYGAYLSACSMYSTIFDESPHKLGYYSVCGKNKGRYLQKIAAKVNL